ncbi:MAG: holo-ACP synthase [Clostridia bacterium]|nr:holo-ACP synthase [Clostridia bacterium]
MCNICGIGLDLCEIGRMQTMLDEARSLRRLFTEAEEAYIRSRGAVAAQSMAGIFAAKEAVCKALGTGITFPLTDITVSHTASGQPTVALSGKAAAFGGTFMISITHEAGMAAAVAIWMK